ncbi:MAG: hypothetical protein FWF23_00860 [Alphaproteobacteria bacterium]|nr:hypothetical protein [Alphaproteobacteria bacterium]MCL2505756.1 hypothetical protein [Alphaproteobacteria bacterium]
MTDYPNFADFNTQPIGLEGKKQYMKDIIGKKILITAFRILKGKYKTQHCLQMQFELEGERFVVFSGSSVISTQLEEHKNMLPFYTAIKRIDRYLTLS